MEYTIVCAVDLGESSVAVVEHALAEARHHPEAFVHLVASVSDGSQSESALETMRELARESMSTFRADTGSRKIFVHAMEEAPADAVLSIADEEHADLIIVGRSGATSGRKPGSTAAEILERAPCSVLTLQAATHTGDRAKQCPACAKVRADSGADKLFCPAHQDGRVARLADRVGVTHHLSGWGLY